MNRTIYLDNAATTRVYPEVIKYMIPFYNSMYGNPMGAYSLGDMANDAVELARSTCASCIGAKKEEIYFTSGGTESDNWVIHCALNTSPKKGGHIITSCIEHSAILKPLSSHNKVTYIPCDKWGLVDVAKIEKAIRPDTVLISVMAANNEIGTIEPIKEIGEMAHRRGILFHTDAVQAFGHIPINVSDNIDYLSASSHKFGGPKGCGFLYAKKGCPLSPFIKGGTQENNMRAGTSNVPGIAGMGLAARISCNNLKSGVSWQCLMRDYMIQSLKNNLTGCFVNGHPSLRLPNNVSATIPGKKAHKMLDILNRNGICASAGSACHSGSGKPSHVLKAIGLSDDDALSTLRFTLGEDITRDEIDFVISVLKSAI